MTYKELQKEAAALGIKAVGVKKDELEKQVMEALQTEVAVPSPKNKTEKKEEPTPKDANTAIVLRGSQEVRRYSILSHGDKFVDLANQFAIKNKYRVELVAVSSGIPCPNCGHVLQQ